VRAQIQSRQARSTTHKHKRSLVAPREIHIASCTDAITRAPPARRVYTHRQSRTHQPQRDIQRPRSGMRALTIMHLARPAPNKCTPSHAQCCTSPALAPDPPPRILMTAVCTSCTTQQRHAVGRLIDLHPLSVTDATRKRGEERMEHAPSACQERGAVELTAVKIYKSALDRRGRRGEDGSQRSPRWGAKRGSKSSVRMWSRHGMDSERPSTYRIPTRNAHPIEVKDIERIEQDTYHTHLVPPAPNALRR
jgi:hypothetical protein